MILGQGRYKRYIVSVICLDRDEEYKKKERVLGGFEVVGFTTLDARFTQLYYDGILNFGGVGYSAVLW